MSEKLLLLSSARTGVLVRSGEASSWWRGIAVAIGLLTIVVGASDAYARLSHAYFGGRAAVVAFAPAIAITEPSALSAISGVSSTTAARVWQGSLIPAQLRIPSLGVSARVESVGKRADGSMGVPTQFGNVSWYMLGSKPGEAGNAVFAGHVNNALTTAGVFEYLSQINLGDSIMISDASGRTLTYVVIAKTDYPANEAPAPAIFATEGPSQIVLITCDGDWVGSARSFDKRLVVVARLREL